MQAPCPPSMGVFRAAITPRMVSEWATTPCWDMRGETSLANSSMADHTHSYLVTSITDTDPKIKIKNRDRPCAGAPLIAHFCDEWDSLLPAPTSSPQSQSPIRVTAPPPPGLALPSSSLSRRRFWGRELPRANYPLPPESSRCDRGQALSRRAGAFRTRALPGRSRSANALLLPSSRERGKFCSAPPAG